MKTFKIFLVTAMFTAGVVCQAFSQGSSAAVEAYRVGVADILTISVLQPDELERVVSVSPDGAISFPYIGTIAVKGLTLAEIQSIVRDQLADGFMKYPVVSVSLLESNSRRFFVYGEVMKPGAYAIEENTTVLRAITVAGGFTKYGSSSRVKVLRPYKDQPGYEPIKVNINDVMNGDPNQDIVLKSGDIVVISEGLI